MVASSPTESPFRDLLARHARILTFRATPADYDALGLPDLAWGMFWVWLAGIGRGWDQPQMALVRRSGIGSVLYVCLLAVLLMIIVAPLRPPHAGAVWRILPFLTLTAPPALLYALPLERWYGIDAANGLNLNLLGLVAVWRVGMYGQFLRRGAGFSPGLVFSALLLPLMGIVASLAVLNLDKVVFEFMRGINPAEKTANDDSYEILILLTMLSYMSILPLLGLYVFQVCARWDDARKSNEQTANAE